MQTERGSFRYQDTEDGVPPLPSAQVFATQDNAAQPLEGQRPR
ncbi:MAG: hypothetical protein AAGA96_09265 [Verrucomicrobiota bacterium]